eukprot:2491143-Rhodomonas_salina.1
MDLVVNGPYKSNTRRLRCEDLREYMQVFRMQFYRAKVHNGPVPVWDQPKHSIAHGLRNSMKAMASMDSDDGFRAGMASAFVQTGLVPVPRWLGVWRQGMHRFA